MSGRGDSIFLLTPRPFTSNGPHLRPARPRTHPIDEALAPNSRGNEKGKVDEATFPDDVAVPIAAGDCLI